MLTIYQLVYSLLQYYSQNTSTQILFISNASPLLIIILLFLSLFLHNTIYCTCTTKPNLNGESPGFIFLHQADGSSFSIIQRVRRDVSICLQMVQLRPNRGHRFKHLQRLLKTLCNLKLSLIYTCILSTPSFYYPIE